MRSVPQGPFRETAAGGSNCLGYKEQILFSADLQALSFPMPQAEGETFIPFRRIKLTVAGFIVLALAVYGFADLPDLYAGNIHGRKGQWLLALHPNVRVAFMGMVSIILLTVGGYCAGSGGGRSSGSQAPVSRSRAYGAPQ